MRRGRQELAIILHSNLVLISSIRIIGGLLSAHLILLDDKQPFGNMSYDAYDGELLYMAHELATRLLPAFDNTATGIPYPRVSACGQRGHGAQR